MGALEGGAHDTHLSNTEAAMAAPYAATMGSDAGFAHFAAVAVGVLGPCPGTKKAPILRTGAIFALARRRVI
jgi:hypothetical protein